VAALLWQCKKDPPQQADPHQCDNVPDYVSPEHEWLQANRIGDTLNFKVYRVKKDTGGIRSYVYLRNERYIATDTGTVIGYEDDPNSVCPDFMWILHEEILNFNGPDPMWSKIVPAGYFDLLHIQFKKKYFHVYNFAYNKPGKWKKSQYYIGNSLCKDVNLFTGTEDIGGSGYTDSTYCFYNLQNGILKFIINDTTVYIRQLNP
jgi:hypothetical protein